MSWPGLSICAAIPLCVATPGAALLPQDGAIVVHAPKLRDWRAVLIAGSGNTLQCRIIRSTGDAALDGLACTAQKQCFEQARPRIADAATRPTAVRKRLMKTIDRDLTTCFATVTARFATYPLDGDIVAPEDPNAPVR